jgi:hypothetical protein
MNLLFINRSSTLSLHALFFLTVVDAMHYLYRPTWAVILLCYLSNLLELVYAAPQGGRPSSYICFIVLMFFLKT